MRIEKFKYYFRKPKSEITKDILLWLMISGLVAIAATSPYFIQNFLRSYKKWKKYPRRKLQDTFTYLRKRGLLETSYKNNQMFISLTDEGKRKAGFLQVDSLKIPRPQKWDGKWRILLFDIAEMKKKHREALRGKLKELGFFLFQKSVWVHAFNCKAEMELLRDFFGLSEYELCLIVVNHIENDKELRKFFAV